MTTPPAGVPRSVRIAALLFALYGVLVVVNAFVLQNTAGWAETRDFPRALLRLAGCGLIAYGLMQGRRWAWWAALILGGLWAVTGAVAMLMLASSGSLDQMPAPSTPAFIVLFTLMLGTAVALLLQPASRDAFR